MITCYKFYYSHTIGMEGTWIHSINSISCNNDSLSNGVN